MNTETPRTDEDASDGWSGLERENSKLHDELDRLLKIDTAARVLGRPKTALKPKARKGEDSAHEPVRNVRCAATMDGDRSIECESGPNYFCFEFRTGAHTQRLKITNDAAWIVREMLDAMHPNICGSSNPLWHKVQAMRKGDAIPNERMHP